MSAQAFPEFVAGGYSRRDGTVQFYARVNALLGPDDIVVDLGAGRGEWLEDTVEYRRNLRLLKGKVAEVIGVDIDPIVSENSACDRTAVMSGPTDIPLPDASADIIVSDHTFEHVIEPLELAVSMHRVLKPGGWVCARTPNRWGYIGLATNIVPNVAHVRLLTRLQPDRKAEDVFPTIYALNSRRSVRTAFTPDKWEVVMYAHNPEPSYFGRSKAAVRVVDAVQTKLPQVVGATWNIFARKR